MHVYTHPITQIYIYIYFFLTFENTYSFIWGCALCHCCQQAFSGWGKRGLLCSSAPASLWGGYFCCRAWVLGARTSVVAAHGLWSTCSVDVVHGLNLFLGVRDLLGPSIELVSLGPQGGFLTTGLPGKIGFFSYFFNPFEYIVVKGIN